MNVTGNTVLIVVDIQGGNVPKDANRTEIPSMEGRADRVPRVTEIIRRFRENDLPVVFIQEVHKPSLVDIGRELDGTEGPHCVEGWPETELAEHIDPRPEEFLIKKRRYSAFFGTELEIVLKAYKAETVVLVGGLTDVCVHYTAVDAHQHDYRFRVVTDGVGGSTQQAHDNALAAMQYLQRDALVTTADVTAWLDDVEADTLEPVR
ncbi:isochorismatase family cysteine hydrolase [Curtobacterium sp. BRB10]|uniref:cysteine hydrolase family protein n=1 Tax=Curtobacterium sp. BRB10 TaxID=2962579 RepID=UPI002880EFFC|nr:isochorismatase family cysteine hydrolase [Curtobacterium sp. BRB10]MDT0235021.1 isochorismatase family cysteine hydrolase [Curtobacterium sp. BRB10]